MSAFRVSAASPHEFMPALRLLRGEQSNEQTEQHNAALIARNFDLSGCFVARSVGGRIRGAALVQIMPGALGVSWPPRGETIEIENAVVLAANDWLRSRGVKVCQAFAWSAELPAMAPLVRNGFRPITQLVFMRSDLSPAVGFLQTPLTFETAVPPFTPEFRQTLLATHEHTLDCPELNQARLAEELLAGLTDELPRTRWHLAKLDNVPIGSVIHSVGIDPTIGELSYLGVVPGARGRGLGGELLKFVLSESIRDNVRAVTLSVDSRNEPALRIYRRFGFMETDRREVFLARWVG